MTGERGEALKLAELKFGEDFAADTAMATKEFQRSLQESGQEAKALAEKRRDEMAARIEQNQQELAQTKLEVLVAPAAELIDLAKAECSDKQDEINIRRQVTKSEGAIASLIRDLICDNVCNVSTLHGTAPTGFDGPLGQLSLTSDALTLDVGKPAAVLQLGGWLRLRPAVTQLTLENADDLALRVLSAHAGRDSPLQTLSVSGTASITSWNALASACALQQVLPALETVRFGGEDIPWKRLFHEDEMDLSERGYTAQDATVVAAVIPFNASLTQVLAFSFKSAIGILCFKVHLSTFATLVCHAAEFVGQPAVRARQVG